MDRNKDMESGLNKDRELSRNKDKEPGRMTDKNRTFLIEAVTGLIVLITLIVFAVWLIIRGSNDKSVNEPSFSQAEEQQVPEGQDIEEAEDDGKTGKNPGTDKNKSGIDLTKEERAQKTKATGELPQTYTPGEAKEWTADNYQLPELYSCWDKYELDAVSDLVRLERMRKISDSLAGSNDYYYYGDKDDEGNPDGKGLAVYADNTYYFGGYSHGKREGDGMWVRVFPDSPGVVNGIKGVTWHQYSGAWADDHPNGEGQENIQYETEGSDIGYEAFAIQNAIGGFKDGFYNGDMYVMTTTGNSSIDWYGTAKKGVFVYLNDKKGYGGKRAIWKAGDGYETGEDENCRWIDPALNADYGIAGLKRAE